MTDLDNKIENPVHLTILHNVPGYFKGTSKRDTRKIKEIMRQFEYEDDFIDSINDDFCLGWNAAKNIITQMLSNMYWNNSQD